MKKPSLPHLPLLWLPVAVAPHWPLPASLPFAPLLPWAPLARSWTTLAGKQADMLTASGSVIRHRLTRMAFAGPNPSARDRREFHKMGQEKVEAAAESLAAMAMQAALSAPQTWLQMAAYWSRTMQSLAGMALRPPANLAAAQAAWAAAAWKGATGLSGQHLRAAASLAQQGLSPVHRRATANARRLARE